MTNVKKFLLMTAGIISVCLGILGILLPVLPTTPFLLLAAFLFAKSSDKLHKWLLTNKLFGNYIKNYIDGKGIPLSTKVMSIVFLWITISISIYFVDIIYVRIIILLVAISVTIHILLTKTFR